MAAGGVVEHLLRRERRRVEPASRIRWLLPVPYYRLPCFITTYVCVCFTILTVLTSERERERECEITGGVQNTLTHTAWIGWKSWWSFFRCCFFFLFWLKKALKSMLKNNYDPKVLLKFQQESLLNHQPPPNPIPRKVLYFCTIYIVAQWDSLPSLRNWGRSARSKPLLRSRASGHSRSCCSPSRVPYQQPSCDDTVPLE